MGAGAAAGFSVSSASRSFAVSEKRRSTFDLVSFKVGNRGANKDVERNVRRADDRTLPCLVCGLC